MGKIVNQKDVFALTPNEIYKSLTGVASIDIEYVSGLYIETKNHKYLFLIEIKKDDVDNGAYFYNSDKRSIIGDYLKEISIFKNDTKRIVFNNETSCISNASRIGIMTDERYVEFDIRKVKGGELVSKDIMIYVDDNEIENGLIYSGDSVESKYIVITKEYFNQLKTYKKNYDD